MCRIGRDVYLVRSKISLELWYATGIRNLVAAVPLGEAIVCRVCFACMCVYFL